MQSRSGRLNRSPVAPSITQPLQMPYMYIQYLHVSHLKTIFRLFHKDPSAEDILNGSVTLTHTFFEPASRVVELFCANDAGNVTLVIDLDVQVDLMTSLAMDDDVTPAAVPLDVGFILTQAVGYPFTDAINASCAFDHAGNDTDEEDETVDVFVSASGFLHNFTYLQDSTSGYVITDVTCSNQVSNATFTFNVTLREAIVTSAFASVQPAFERGTPAQFRVNVTSGSHVTSVVDFGDGETLHFDPDLESGLDRASWLVEHVYTDIGNYTVTLRSLYNEIYEDSTELTTDVVIQDAIADLNFSSVHPFVTYDNAPAAMSFTMTSSSGDRELTDLHCEFVASPGGETWFLFMATLPQEFGDDSVVPLFDQASDVVISVTATCHNMITQNYVVEAQFEIVLNDINLVSFGSLNNPDWWRNRTRILTVVSPIYSVVDFTVAMGDGNDCTFMTSSASQSDARCEFTMTTTDYDVSVLLTYEYETWGVYDFSLSASNGIPLYDVTGVQKQHGSARVDLLPSHTCATREPDQRTLFGH